MQLIQFQLKFGKVNFLEGCLSLPGYYWEIERPEYAKLDCFDLKREKKYSMKEMTY
ncbi:MAG: hypothetical protein Ct9H90mP3_6830 [Flammeovirgaceae bacterium]|nr:MAG: hypothetical protein Ct9H90mP3_6830 [Flammeovirgaceae bacterium]